MNLKEIFTFNSESSELVLTKDDELFLEKIAKKNTSTWNGYSCSVFS